MGLLDRLRRPTEADSGPARTSLAADARAMRDLLDGLRREAAGGRVQLRRVVSDLLEGELPAPTADVRMLRDRETDPAEFYEREVAPSWDGLNEAKRATRLDGFFEMCSMLESAADLGAVPPEMAASVRTKTLLLGWAFDEEYGYLPRLARDEALPE
jgi:hypothetical protein